MIRPQVVARVEKPNLCLRVFVKGCDIVRLIEVARTASQGQIVGACFSTPRLRGNVLDLKRQIEERFGSAAILADVTGPGGH